MLFGDNYTTELKPENKTASELKLSTHFETDKTIDEITNNVSGYSWEVDFYNQLITSNDASTSLDLNLSTAVQRYRKIENMEIKLQSSISSTTIEDIKGEASINIGSAIYKYDLFTSRMRDNRIGIFQVDNVSSNTYELNQIVTIEFSILGFGDTEYDLYRNLLSKVDTEYIYDIGYRKQNGSPIVAKKEYLNHNMILENCIVYMTNYLSKFLNLDVKMIVLPIDNDLLVDPFLNDFILAVFSSNDIPLLKSVSRVETNTNRIERSTIFKSILGYLDLKYAHKLYFTYTDNDVYLKNYLNIKYIVTDVNMDTIVINDKSHFISDTFYTYGDTTTIDNSFESILYKFILGKDLSTLEDIRTCIDATLEMEDFNLYFRLPILVMIYRQTSYMFKG